MTARPNKKSNITEGSTSARKKRGRNPPLPAENSQETSLCTLVENINVCKFFDYREYVAALYEIGKKVYTSYSYAQFAADLGFSKTNVMWLVITGRRKLTQDSAETIIAALKLKSEHGTFLKILCQYNNTTKSTERAQLFNRLVDIASRESQIKANSRQMDYFREWYHPIIRELTATAQFQSDPNWIAAKLCVKVSPLQVKKSLELLVQLGLIQYDETAARHVRTTVQVVTDRDFSAITLISYHQKMCEIARDSVALVAAKDREFNVLTVSLSESGMTKTVDIIRRACEEIMALEQDQTSTEQVFQVNLQLFPVTKPSSTSKAKILGDTEKSEKLNAKK
jgi:uncharacterized protein (TIGR02147 family)